MIGNRDGSPRVGLPKPETEADVIRLYDEAIAKAKRNWQVNIMMEPRAKFNARQMYLRRRAELGRYKSYWLYKFQVETKVNEEYASMGVEHKNALKK